MNHSFPLLVPGSFVGNPAYRGASGSPGSKSSQVTAPFVAQRVTVSVTDTSWMHCGQVLFMEGEGYFEVSAIINSSNVVLKNLTADFRVTEREEIHELVGYDS